MTNEQITVIQHYVPQFLLRNFSVPQDARFINIYDMEQSTFRYNQAINRSFAESSFYDKDNMIERQLYKIEVSASKVINKILSGDYLIDQSEKKIIATFVSTQLSRTKAARNSIKSLFHHIQKVELKKIIQLVEDDELKSSLIKNPGEFIYDKNSYRNIAALTTIMGIVSSIGLSDLNIRILINKTKLPFIISDSPVSLYNSLYQSNKKLIPLSAYTVGSQLFLPISKEMCIYLYDAKVLEFKNTNNVLPIAFLNEKDVRGINLLQANLAKFYLGFSDKKIHSYIRGLASLSKQSSIPNIINEEIHIFHGRFNKLNVSLSFVKLKPEAKLFSNQISLRNAPLMKCINELMFTNNGKVIKSKNA